MTIGLENTDKDEDKSIFRWLIDGNLMTESEYDAIITHDQGEDCVAFIKSNNAMLPLTNPFSNKNTRLIFQQMQKSTVIQMTKIKRKEPTSVSSYS